MPKHLETIGGAIPPSVCSTSLRASVLAALTACIATAGPASIEWKTDGTVVRDGVSIVTRLTTITGAIEWESGIYLSGNQTLASGEITDYVAFVAASGGDPEYWQMPASVHRFFRIGDSVHVALYSGECRVRVPRGWTDCGFRFQKAPAIVQTTPAIVACSPTTLPKLGRKVGSCYAVDGAWEARVNWREVEPQVCRDGVLSAVELRGDEAWSVELDLGTGHVLAERRLTSMPKSACP